MLKGKIITLRQNITLLNKDEEFVLGSMIFISEGTESKVNATFQNITGIIKIGNQHTSINEYEEVDTSISIPHSNIMVVQHL